MSVVVEAGPADATAGLAAKTGLSALVDVAAAVVVADSAVVSVSAVKLSPFFSLVPVDEPNIQDSRAVICSCTEPSGRLPHNLCQRRASDIFFTPDLSREQ